MIRKIILAVVIAIFSARPVLSQMESADTSFINTSHLDHLFEAIKIENQPMGIIHIYAEAPEYKWTEAPGEGIACVDDVARAAIFYLRYHAALNDSASLSKARSLLNFLFYMQAPNGLFYNFINKDYSINKKAKNSQPAADWWTWRALWAMGEAYHYLKGKDSALEEKLNQSLQKGFSSIKALTKKFPKTITLKAMKLPSWLPYEYASDQAAVMLLALIPYYQAGRDTSWNRDIRIIAKGIVMMQLGDSVKFPYGAHLSWQNTWHAWGSNQAEALLRAGQALKDDEMIKSALKEINHFYLFLIKENYFSEFSVVKGHEENIKKYPQIAYGINPMVSACLEAYKLTQETKYAERAADLAAWFYGKNSAKKAVYDTATGRCYDGIVSKSKINYNSGAESTIEALMALLAIEQNPVSRKALRDILQGKQE